ncbi:MAG: hypothetical protein EXS35_09975 [Pedosphaera sp.]|nr:hypothetical protein [Pedosphaera sp.]
MSRFRNFAHSLASGYVLLAANMVYTLATVPLAWRYLSKTEFGLWTTTSVVAQYLSLVDFGMSGSVARILIDHKDSRRDGRYGSLIQVGALVGIVQGALAFLLSVALAFALGPLLKVPEEFRASFAWLMIGQCGLLAVSFVGRIFNQVLTAHQRFDIVNYAQAALFAVSYGIMWFGFAHGQGVFAILWSQLTSVVTVIVAAVACARLNFFPQRGEWGRPNRALFDELFAFGRDIFLYALGGQLVSASQSLLLTRFFGLDVAAVWNVCTRAFTVLAQLLYRIFDFSSSALAEMMVRTERERLLNRFKQIAVASTSLSVAAGTVFAVCNSAFVEIWTSGKIDAGHATTDWFALNDWLLGAWLVLCVVTHAHTGFIGQSKKLGFLRYVFFLEGLVFIGLMALLHRFGGITIMLALSLGCGLAFSLPYGLRRTRAYCGLSWREVAEWHRPSLRLALCAAPVAAAVWWFTRDLPVAWRLAANGALVGGWTLVMLLRFGLDASLQTELIHRAPVSLRRIISRLTGLSQP